MKKPLIALALSALMALTIAGCASNQNASSATADSADSSSASSQAVSLDENFDGNGCQDTGAGSAQVIGNVEGSNAQIPQINADGASSMSVEISIEGMEHVPCTVYVDGARNTEFDVGDSPTETITLSGSELDPGVHKIELVAQEDGFLSLYKYLEYEVIN